MDEIQEKINWDSYLIPGTDVLKNTLNEAVLDEGIKKAAYETARANFYSTIADSNDSTRFPEKEQEKICFEEKISDTE